MRGWAPIRRRLPFCITIAVVIGVWLAVFQTLLDRELNPPRWERQIRAFEQRDRTNSPPTGAVLFVGGSSIQLWESLKRDLTNYTVVRRGFGGAIENRPAAS